jgi:hypothetical protein
VTCILFAPNRFFVPSLISTTLNLGSKPEKETP